MAENAKITNLATAIARSARQQATVDWNKILASNHVLILMSSAIDI